jgi:hypothetical protein
MNNDPQRPWATPQYSCPSGNCTWNPVAALEARALCEDITSLLTVTCHESIFGGARLENCTSSLLGNTIQAWFLAESNQGRIFVSNGLGTSAVPQSLDTNTTLGAVQFIVQERKVEADWLDAGGSASKQVSHPTECAIVTMVRSFRASVENNNYAEEALAIWDVAIDPSEQLDVRFEPPWGQELGVNAAALNHSFGYTKLSMLAIANLVKDSPTGYLNRGITNTVYAAESSAYAGRDILQALDEGATVGCSDDLAARLNCSMANIAQAISKTFRDSRIHCLNPNDESGRAVAAVRVSATHIGVRWGWIVLLVLVLLLGCLVLAGTMWKARRRNLPKWKNNPLPLLFLHNGAADQQAGGQLGLLVHGSLAHLDEMRLRLDMRDGRIFLR